MAALLASPVVPDEARASLALAYAEVADEVRAVVPGLPDAVPADGRAALRAVAVQARQRRRALVDIGHEMDELGREALRDPGGVLGRAQRRLELNRRRTARLRALFWLRLAASLGVEDVLEHRRELGEAAGQLADPEHAFLDPVRRSAPFLAPGLMVGEVALTMQLLAAAPGDDLDWSLAVLEVGGHLLAAVRKRQPRAAELEPTLEPLFAESATAPLALRALGSLWAAERGRAGVEALALSVLRDLPAARDAWARSPSAIRLRVVDETAEHAHDALAAVGRAAAGRAAVDEMMGWLAGPGAAVGPSALRAHTLIRKAEFMRFDDGGRPLRDAAMASALRAILDDPSQDRFHDRARRALRSSASGAGAPATLDEPRPRRE